MHVYACVITVLTPGRHAGEALLPHCRYASCEAAVAPGCHAGSCEHCTRRGCNRAFAALCSGSSAFCTPAVSCVRKLVHCSFAPMTCRHCRRAFVPRLKPYVPGKNKGKRQRPPSTPPARRLAAALEPGDVDCLPSKYASRETCSWSTSLIQLGNHCTLRRLESSRSQHWKVEWLPPSLSPAHRALVRSQAGPHAGAWLTVTPTRRSPRR